MKTLRSDTGLKPVNKNVNYYFNPEIPKTCLCL